MNYEWNLPPERAFGHAPDLICNEVLLDHEGPHIALFSMQGTTFIGVDCDSVDGSNLLVRWVLAAVSEQEAASWVRDQWINLNAAIRDKDLVLVVDFNVASAVSVLEPLRAWVMEPSKIDKRLFEAVVWGFSLKYPNSIQGVKLLFGLESTP